MSTLQVSRGFTYHYIHYPPSLDPAPGPYVLFLHGWPSYSQEWHHQIDHFRKLGYGVIAPDLIGSGRSSRPSDVNNYVLKDITADVIEILDHEKISTVYAVGHDWGSFLLARLGVYYPERVERLCFIAVGYRAPGQPVDLDAINRMTAQKLGYSIFGYQVYFTRNDQADAALLEHVRDQVLRYTSSMKLTNAFTNRKIQSCPLSIPKSQNYGKNIWDLSDLWKSGCKATVVQNGLGF